MIARIWIKKGIPDYAAVHVQKALQLYSEWGSKLNISNLTKLFGSYITDSARYTRRRSMDITPDEEEDVKTPSPYDINMHMVAKAAEAISLDSTLDEFMDNMFKVR